MNAHTPGPGKSIACLQPYNSREPVELHNHNELVANARLIAAAPDLLAALEEIVRHERAQGMEEYPPSQIARAAIAKATT